jgi:hypothetical protein
LLPRHKTGTLRSWIQLTILRCRCALQKTDLPPPAAELPPEEARRRGDAAACKEEEAGDIGLACAADSTSADEPNDL